MVVVIVGVEAAAAICGEWVKGRVAADEGTV
jgi:hypothetical protein